MLPEVPEHGGSRRLPGHGGLRVGACQTPEILGDIGAAVACIERFARLADRRGVDLLLFPECFLQGYLVEPAHVSDHALELGSGGFARVLRRLDRAAGPGYRDVAGVGRRHRWPW